MADAEEIATAGPGGLRLSKFIANGVDGAAGSYLLPELTSQQLAEVALGTPIDNPELRELRWWHQQQSEAVFGVAEHIDPCNLAEAGWGLIASTEADPAVLQALMPLRELRREQSSAGGQERNYQEFTGEHGYRRGESKQQFLGRFGVGPGPANPANGVPYYLLIVGGPESVPFSFQYQLDVAYAVGRVVFEAPEQYAAYARAVVAAERAQPEPGQRRLAFFAPANAHDRATELSASQLVSPLAAGFREDARGWSVQSYVGPVASKPQLIELMGGTRAPDLVFTASHGVGFPPGDARQLGSQGALVCQDWAGPQGHSPLSEAHYVAARDITDDASVQGSIFFSFACFGAGTPQMDDFTRRAFREPVDIAPRAFVAQLPQRLLSHPRGGALAFVGHVERAWGCSFLWAGTRQLDTFRSTLGCILDGFPIGAAMEYFNNRYAELSSDLTSELEEIRNNGRLADEFVLADMWTANNDARSYAVIGDPAVRLARRETPGGAG
jgi:hypothetical protein